ncbi:hypothetical protein D3C77_431320 [compost metagenome]
MTAAATWQPPAPEEIQSLLDAVGKRLRVDVDATLASNLLGLGPEGNLVVTEWLQGRASILYPCWAVLCEMAGLGLIWRVGEKPRLFNFN